MSQRDGEDEFLNDLTEQQKQKYLLLKQQGLLQSISSSANSSGIDASTANSSTIDSNSASSSTESPLSKKKKQPNDSIKKRAKKKEAKKKKITDMKSDFKTQLAIFKQSKKDEVEDEVEDEEVQLVEVIETTENEEREQKISLLAEDVADKVFSMINQNYGISGSSLIARDKQTLLSSLQLLRPTISQSNYSSRESFHLNMAEQLVEAFAAYVEFRGVFPSKSHLFEISKDLVDRTRTVFHKSFKEKKQKEPSSNRKKKEKRKRDQESSSEESSESD